MKSYLIIFLCLVLVSPIFGNPLTRDAVKFGAVGFTSSTSVALAFTSVRNSTTLEGSTVNLLKGVKVIVLGSYVGLVSLIVTLSLKRRKMIEHFQNLKREHLALCEEVKGRIEICSTLSSQTNQKARELTSCTLSVIQKHNVLAVVNSELKALSTVFDETTLNDPSIGRKFKSVSEVTTTDNRNYWNDFISHFNLLYPNYLMNVKSRGSEITDKELKLAALLRLGLDTKKIAGLLNLSPVSIKVFRHRLRKKLELPEDVNLYNYLSHFDN